MNETIVNPQTPMARIVSYTPSVLQKNFNFSFILCPLEKQI